MELRTPTPEDVQQALILGSCFGCIVVCYVGYAIHVAKKQHNQDKSYRPTRQGIVVDFISPTIVAKSD